MLRPDVRVLATIGALIGWITVVLPIRDTWHPEWAPGGAEGGRWDFASDYAVRLFELDTALPVVVLVLGTLLGVVVWLPRVPKAWGVLALIVAVAQFAVWIPLLERQTVFWDGVDATGEHIGGAFDIDAWFGWGALALGSLFLAAAGARHLLSLRSPSPSRSGQPEAAREPRG